MVIYFLILICVSVFGMSLAKRGQWFDSLSKSQTSAINGISILLVLVCHIFIALNNCDYAWNGFGDSAFLLLKRYIRQLCVVSFLFYSGYGVMIQILETGNEYIDAFPLRRILSFYLNFVIAVCVYAVIHFVLQDGISARQVVASFTCLRQIGNPSWYVFCILWCYTSTWMVAKISRKLGIGSNGAGVGILILTLVYIVLFCLARPHMKWWYNTVLAYPAGVFLAVNREAVIFFARRFWVVLFILSAVIFGGLYTLPYDSYGLEHALRHGVMGSVLMLLIVLFTMKVRVGNVVLDWCGRHVFPLYIYHFAFYLIIKRFYLDGGGSCDDYRGVFVNGADGNSVS